jgi:hypothetical protein
VTICSWIASSSTRIDRRLFLHGQDRDFFCLKHGDHPIKQAHAALNPGLVSGTALKEMLETAICESHEPVFSFS